MKKILISMFLLIVGLCLVGCNIESNYQHNVCEECGKCIAEDCNGTENEKCQGHLVITDAIPVPITSITFNGGSELEEFIKNYENFNKWVYMNEIIKNNEVINVYNKSYSFNYDEEKDGKYINPYLTISFALYSEALGTDTGDDDVLYHSISFLINIRPNDLKDNISYKLCKYSNSENMYNNVVLIYSGDNVIGEAYYYTKLDVTKNWITEFLNENLLVPIRIK